jgi:spermidine synthase
MTGSAPSAGPARPISASSRTEPQRRRGLPPLELLVFVVGASTLGAEIAAARLMAPFFGASTIVWANTIAVVLVALSVGYWFGGRMADRRPDLRSLCGLVLGASLLLGLVPIVAQPFLSLSVKAFDDVSLGAGFGSLLGVLALVAIPVLMLGAVSPWAIRLKLERVEDSGEVAGRMYAISTVGSLLGTFLSALALIPLVGTQRTFLVFALALAVVAALGLSRRWALVPLGVAALLALPIGTVKAAEEGRVVDEAETEYQYARVIEASDGERTLELNEGQAIHSLYRPGTVLTGGYWDGFLVAPFAVLREPPRRVAILGFAGGTTARAYARYFPAARIDGVEIDRELFDIGRRWFGLRARPQLHEYAEDARPFLRKAHARYDAIFVDAYRQPYIPFYLSTREFFALARDRLAPSGVVVVNVGHPEGSDRLEQVLSATMARAFAHVARDPVEPTNTLLIASRRPIASAALARAARGLPADLRPLALRSAARLRPPLRGGAVYTDDRAPVEWLIDKSIVSYAAGGEPRGSR